jgi:hypothetical protein
VQPQIRDAQLAQLAGAHSRAPEDLDESKTGTRQRAEDRGDGFARQHWQTGCAAVTGG